MSEIEAISKKLTTKFHEARMKIENFKCPVIYRFIFVKDVSTKAN
jgi:hypothetical protein